MRHNCLLVDVRPGFGPIGSTALPAEPGDRITVDVPSRGRTLEVDDAEVRAAALRAYALLATSADHGVVRDVGGTAWTGESR